MLYAALYFPSSFSFLPCSFLSQKCLYVAADVWDTFILFVFNTLMSWMENTLWEIWGCFHPRGKSALTVLLPSIIIPRIKLLNVCRWFFRRMFSPLACFLTCAGLWHIHVILKDQLKPHHSGFMAMMGGVAAWAGIRTHSLASWSWGQGLNRLATPR